jgi:hypothetical protein
MTPKEKALDLYWKYYNRIEHTLSEEYSKHETFLCKQCALIAVEQILEIIFSDYDWQYWNEVKQELEKL